MINWIEELLAQIEAHGGDAVAFYLWDSDGDQYVPLEIKDVSFEDGQVKVVVEE